MVGVRGLENVLVDGSKIIYITSSIGINNDFSLLIFIDVFLCLLISPKLITTNLFQHVDTLQPLLQNSSSLLKSSTCAELLNMYPSSLQIYLPMTLHFRAHLNFKYIKIFILSKNLALILVNTKIIIKKVENDLKIGRVEELIAKPCLLFISSHLDLMLKYISGWQ